MNMQTTGMLASRPARDTHQRAIVDFLRKMVISPTGREEKFHVLFLGQNRVYLGDIPLATGGAGALSIRMRDLFAYALGLGAQSVVIAHNHPSGQCRPSQRDIEATERLNKVAGALDIELLDHLIFTQGAVYSMRAGGKL